MIARSVAVSLLPAVLLLAPATSNAQAKANAQASTSVPERAVRRDIPMTRMIQRAFAAGTRDSTGRPGRNYWQLWTDYRINASLDPSTSVVTGRETITVRNNSDSAMRGVVLRLDQNFFRPDVPRQEVASELTEGMQITRFIANGTPVNIADTMGMAIPGSRRRTVPIATEIRNTSARIPLATPIAAHSSGTLEIDWNFRVPRVDNGRGTRMGRWADTLYQVAQWYPRVAVFDDLRQGGWDTDPYLGPAEFYNNFGHFDVSIEVPAGWIVGSTGVLQNPNEVLTPTARERLSHVLESDSVRSIVSASERGPGKSTATGNRLVWHFVADTVGDVAWATSNQFVWDATRATIPGRGAVPINILYLPGHAQQYAQAGPVARHALEFYSRLWMPYAFPQLTMVDGPELGMEYPMFIMSAVFAADHETGHQWWPMMVGVNETWYGFMDEGFNQYMNILSDADYAHQIPKLDSLGLSYGRISGNELEPPLMWDENYAGPLYSFAAYGKAPMMLSSLGGVVGDTAVQRAMSEYAKAWRFKHPSPWDYAFFMNNALHRDLGWFWNYWLFTTESVDGSIQNVATNGRRTTVTVRENGQMPSPVVLKVEFAPTGPAIRPMPNATMVDGNTAIVTYPVDVWFAGSRTFNANLDFGGRAITRVTFDPAGRFPDRDPSDNVWPRTSAAVKTGGGR
ncbi:MAG TPA: M1 family metallopeptidase [Gemmatimonadaceae bacterium]|nr:M1 family metallopeptidase [Gemmatimonadaceae bacterium]